MTSGVRHAEKPQTGRAGIMAFRAALLESEAALDGSEQAVDERSTEREMAASVTQRVGRIGGISGCISMAVLAGFACRPARAAYHTAMFGVSATVLGTCQISASPYISERLASVAAGTVHVRCSAQTSYRIATETVSPVSIHLDSSPAISAPAHAEASAVRAAASAAPVEGAAQAVSGAADGDLILTVQY